LNLILAIVNEHDVAGVVDALTASGYGVTRINTASGLLKMSNVTLLVGVEDDRADEAVEIIRANCRPHIEPAPPPSLIWPEEHVPPLPSPKEVTVGGAVIFILAVKRYEHL
jgi:uncharacterized protein YaaQ